MVSMDTCGRPSRCATSPPSVLLPVRIGPMRTISWRWGALGVADTGTLPWAKRRLEAIEGAGVFGADLLGEGGGEIGEEDLLGIGVVLVRVIGGKHQDVLGAD